MERIDFDKQAHAIIEPVEPIIERLGPKAVTTFEHWVETTTLFLMIIAARAQNTSTQDHDYLKELEAYAITKGFDPSRNYTGEAKEEPVSA